MRSAKRTICASRRGGLRHRPRVVHDAVADLPGQVQPAAVVLEVVDDRAGSARCAGTDGRGTAQSACSPRWPNGVWPRSWPERDRLGEVLVQPERSRDRPGDLADLERVREPDPVVVALGREEHLRLVLQPAERLRVDDAVAVALEAGPERGRAARRRSRPFARRGQRGVRRERLALDLLGALAGGHHARHGSARLDDAAGAAAVRPVGRPPT